MLGAGMADDLFEILFLAFVLLVSEQGNLGLAVMTFPIKLILFIALVYLVVRMTPALVRYIRKEHSETSEFSMVIVIALFIAALSFLFGLGPILGAFIAGLIMQWSLTQAEERKMAHHLKILSFAFIVPFFFINIGLNFNALDLVKFPVLFAAILVAAIAAKILGSMTARWYSDLTTPQTMLIGWGMNTRGAVELVIAEIARLNNLIPLEVYSAIIGLVVVSTVIFPFILRYYVRRYPSIME